MTVEKFHFMVFTRCNFRNLVTLHVLHEGDECFGGVGSTTCLIKAKPGSFVFRGADRVDIVHFVRAWSIGTCTW